MYCRLRILGLFGFEWLTKISNSNFRVFGWTDVGNFLIFGIFWTRNGRSSEIGPERMEIGFGWLGSAGWQGLGLLEARKLDRRG